MNNINRSQIFDTIEQERQYQDMKWGNINEHPHTIREWIAIMSKKLKDAEYSYFQKHADFEMIAEIIQVIAVGFACLEQHGTVNFRDNSNLKNVNLNEILNQNVKLGSRNR